MEVSGLIKKYLGEAKMMQVATVKGDQPWICTVYFMEDDNLNLFWLSLPTRRHSQEIASHNKIAVTVPIKFDQPVIGIQAEGTADIANKPKQIADIMKLYTNRYNAGEDFYNNFVTGKNQHLLYRFTPKRFVLFDEVNFPDDSCREWKPE